MSQPPFPAMAPGQPLPWGYQAMPQVQPQMQPVRPVQAVPPQPAAQPVAHTEEPVAKRQRVDEPQQQAEPHEVAPAALPTIPAPVTEGDVVEVC